MFTGTKGNDTLQATSASEGMNAGDGDDVLTGAGGGDTMNGADGADLFLFGPGFGKDEVIGFKVGEDKIHVLDYFDGTSLDTHVEAFAFFDSNGDTTLSALDDRISLAKGRLVLDFGEGNQISFVGVKELGSDVFDGAMV